MEADEGRNHSSDGEADDTPRPFPLHAVRVKYYASRRAARLNGASQTLVDQGRGGDQQSSRPPGGQDVRIRSPRHAVGQPRGAHPDELDGAPGHRAVKRPWRGHRATRQGPCFALFDNRQVGAVGERRGAPAGPVDAGLREGAAVVAAAGQRETDGHHQSAVGELTTAGWSSTGSSCWTRRH